MVFVPLLCLLDLSAKPFVSTEFSVLFGRLDHPRIFLNLATGEFAALEAYINSTFLTTLPNLAAGHSISPLAASAADKPAVLPKEIQPLSELSVTEILDLGRHPVITAGGID